MRSFMPILCASAAIALPHNVVRQTDGQSQAASTNITISGGSLPGLLYINGKPHTSTPAAALNAQPICNPTVDDVMTCAQNARAQMMNPADTTSTGLKHKFQLLLPLGVPEAYAQATYDSTVHSCEISQPYVVEKQSIWPCSIDTCQKQISLTQSTTETTHDGYKMGVSLGVTVGEKDLFSTTVTVSTEESTDFTSSVTKTSQITDTWTMKAGQICAPASIQMTVSCSSTLKVSEFTFINHDGSYFTGNGYGPGYNLCDHATTDQIAASLTSNGVTPGSANPDILAAVKALCSGSTNSAGTDGSLKVDLSSGATDGSVWTMEGCLRR